MQKLLDNSRHQICVYKKHSFFQFADSLRQMTGIVSPDASVVKRLHKSEKIPFEKIYLKMCSATVKISEHLKGKNVDKRGRLKSTYDKVWSWFFLKIPANLVWL